MRTYYHSREALVDDEFFVWRGANTQIFPVAALREVHIVRGQSGTLGFAAMMATTAGLVTLAVASWAVIGQLAGYALAGTATVVAAIAARRPQRRATKVWNLEATLHGTRVTVYSSTDVRVFNQVTRALVRSIEVNQPAPQRYDLAAG